MGTEETVEEHRMKVAVTFEFTDDELVAIGLMETGTFRKAMRKDARIFITNTVMGVVEAATPIVKEQQEKVSEEVRRNLGILGTGKSA